jgi:hypothetical protein
MDSVQLKAKSVHRCVIRLPLLRRIDDLFE